MALIDRPGVPSAWDSVPYGGRGLGYVDAMHQSLRPYAGATVLTAYAALPAAERGALLTEPWSHWSRRVVDELSTVHPDLPERVQRIDLMRYGKDAPRDVMDLLFAELMLWGRAQGYRRFDLGMAPLSGLEAHQLAPLLDRAGALVFRHGEHFYNFEGLRRYKDKFKPVWERDNGFALGSGGVFLVIESKEHAQARGATIEVGYAHHTRAFEPLRSYHPLDRVVARVIEQAFIWDFSDAVASGVLSVTNTSHRAPIPGLKGTQDYLGINYYGRFYVKTDLLAPTKFQVLMHDPETPEVDKPNDLGWASYPRGFGLILQRAGSRYRLPIYVLENGTADRKDDDTDRQRLLVEHVKEMWLARQHGADVRGYFHWSLLDNFEWAEGFDARFGLIKVDYKDGFRRTPRPSAALYTRIIEHNGLDEELARHYGLLPE